jgi:hypothetical protein
VVLIYAIWEEMTRLFPFGIPAGEGALPQNVPIGAVLARLSKAEACPIRRLKHVRIGRKH